MIVMENENSSGDVTKVELHLHSLYSPDSRMTIKEIVHRYRELEYDAIAITDHDDIRSHNHLRQIEEKTGLIAIPGVEISSADGHIIGLMTQEDIPKGLSAEETLDRIRDQGGYSILAHPYDRFRSGVRDKAETLACNAIEVWNANVVFANMNKKARKTCEERGLGKTGGSDAHFIHNIGNGWTEIYKGVESCEEIISELRKGNSDGKGRHEGLAGKARRGIMRLPWKIKGQKQNIDEEYPVMQKKSESSVSE